MNIPDFSVNTPIMEFGSRSIELGELLGLGGFLTFAALIFAAVIRGKNKRRNSGGSSDGQA